MAENITENELARLTDTSRLEKSEKNEKRNENRKSETSRKRKLREEDEMAEKTNKQAKIDYDNKECTGDIGLNRREIKCVGEGNTRSFQVNCVQMDLQKWTEVMRMTSMTSLMTILKLPMYML